MHRDLDSKDIYITDNDGIQQKLQQLPSTDSEKALGIEFSPSGDMKAEANYLRQKALEWADKVRSGHLTHQEAWYCLRSTVLRTIEYAIPATTFSYKQTESFMRPILTIGLPRSGICRNISRQIVYSPIKYQGFGIRHPFISQGIAKIRLLFAFNQSLSSQLINASWYRTQKESGFGHYFLQKNYEWIQHVLTPGWVTSLWEFLSLYEIDIRRVGTTSKRQHRHSKDEYIMERVSKEMPAMSKPDRIIFNNCRLYLQVELISDILTANGHAIQQHLWKGTRYTPPNTGWPPIPELSASAWKIWRTTLQSILNTNEQGWCHESFPAVENTTDWIWYLQPMENRLYERCQNHWNEYSVSGGRRNSRNHRYSNSVVINSPPDNLIPVTVYHNGNGKFIDGKGLTSSIIQNVVPTWNDYANITEIGNIAQLALATQQGAELLVVSDGSSKDNEGGAGWIITTEHLFHSGIYIYWEKTKYQAF